MFEGSLVESRGPAVSRAQRWSAIGSAAAQVTIAALVAALPLMRPQTLKILPVAPHLTALPLPARPPEVVRMAPSNASSKGPSAPAALVESASLPRFFPLTPEMPAEDGPPGPMGPIAMGPADPMPAFGTGGSNSAAVTVAHATPSSRRIALSGGVSQGMLLSPMRPVYPQIAVLTKTQGTVVVEAVISKAGKIESAHAVSGPPMLRQAALDAVSSARYRPYLLSGEPVEVQTTVTVVFQLGE